VDNIAGRRMHHVVTPTTHGSLSRSLVNFHWRDRTVIENVCLQKSSLDLLGIFGILHHPSTWLGVHFLRPSFRRGGNASHFTGYTPDRGPWRLGESSRSTGTSTTSGSMLSQQVGHNLIVYGVSQNSFKIYET